ncbi:MAG: hypothetical protein HWN81_00345 [Candidatus Lokiarchaeota archaeon]|nr:hypothetical protein [Candidatus Lokiarchaeota archaeon]
MGKNKLYIIPEDREYFEVIINFDAKTYRINNGYHKEYSFIVDNNNNLKSAELQFTPVRAKKFSELYQQYLNDQFENVFFNDMEE